MVNYNYVKLCLRNISYYIYHVLKEFCATQSYFTIRTIQWPKAGICPDDVMISRLQAISNDNDNENFGGRVIP